MNRIYCRPAPFRKEHNSLFYWDTLGTRKLAINAIRIYYKRSRTRMGTYDARTFTMAMMVENPIIIIRKAVEL